MSYKITDIEGVGPAYGTKLAKADIKTTADLLSKCATPAGRKKVAAAAGISEGQILKWTNLADLMRISGVGPQFSELLEAAGVDTVKELRNRNAANLATAMAEVNGVKKLTRVSPAARTVGSWVKAAKSMDPVIKY